MMIRFELTPVEQVQPWNGDLYWFPLSSGSYWIDLGTDHLFEYADGTPVEYFLARLHSDLLDNLPEILDPIPAKLAERFLEGSAIVTWHALYDSTDDLDDPLFDALEGFRVRSLDSLYLTPGARILQWRLGDEIIVEWDHRRFETCPWSATGLGRVAIPVQTYLADLRRFHEELMAQMAERLRFATIPSEEEHRRRERELARELARPAEKYDWDLLLASL